MVICNTRTEPTSNHHQGFFLYSITYDFTKVVLFCNKINNITIIGRGGANISGAGAKLGSMPVPRANTAGAGAVLNTRPGVFKSKLNLI